jgi:hypothetical protein
VSAMPLTFKGSVSPDTAHVPGPPEMYGVKFRSACRCGYPGKDATTPSHAYGATEVHANNANRREAAGGPTGEATSGQRGAGTASTPRSPRTPRSTSGGGPCGCGCGETCGGRFRPGHDAKLLSRLQTEVKSGVKTRDDVLAELSDHPNLQAKLAGRLA